MYQALYRKYRPKDFNSVVGQDAVIKTLKNSIINHNFSHAYMFFGPRGTGKTSISKIFARNINCLNPKDGIACQECEHCKVSFSKDCIDIIEIDAASNNGVDEIRDLKNKISLVPSELKYKIYIIDEVHMLSIGAFNALLKTLEEPPEHAIFILATTDPQKVPETIISRCQCFSFKRISTDIIEKRLKFVCDEEKIDIDEEVLRNISILSDGGLRDALGLLDKLTSYTSSKITMDDFVDINGIISKEELINFLKKTMDGDISFVLREINNYDVNGKNLIQIITQLLNLSRDLIVDYYLNDHDVDFSIDNLQIFANLLNEKIFDIKKSGNTKIYIEMLILKFINDYILKKSKNISKKIGSEVENVDKKNVYSAENVNNLQEKDEKVSKITNEVVVEQDNSEKIKEYSDVTDDNNLDTDLGQKIINIDEIIKVRVNNTLACANKNLLKHEISNFELLNDYTFDQEIGYVVCFLLDSKVRAVSSENIIISYDSDSVVKQNLLIIDKIMDVYNKITNSNKKIAIISDAEWERVKNEYITNLKNNIKYEIKDEPEVIFEESKKDDIIVNSAIDLFGDIVEVD